MKKTAILVNTSRGPMVDEKALVKALKTGVSRRGPRRLRERAGARARPDDAAEHGARAAHGSATVETRLKMWNMAVANCIAGLTGQRPPNLLNPDVSKPERAALAGSALHLCPVRKMLPARDGAVSLAEAESYRSMNAERWSSGAGDPFVEISGYPGLRQIRKREDGACVFLADDGRCRLHQELGFNRKPLSCRVFPFRFHPIESDVVVTSSFSCPTVVANEGTLLSTQAADLHALHLAWKREQPEAAATVQLVDGYPLPRPMLPRLSSLLSRILDVPGPDGSFNLVLSVRRVAAFLEDLSRPRVRKLAENDLNHLDVMSRHAVDPETAPPARKASRLTRLVFRGFLLSAMSVQLHLEPYDRQASGRNSIRALPPSRALAWPGPWRRGFRPSPRALSDTGP